MWVQHEIDAIADRILDRVSIRLVAQIRATIKKEMRHMTDQAITDLKAATDDILAVLTQAVTTGHDEAVALAAALTNQAAATGVSLAPDIEAQVVRLTTATTAAKTALAALAPAPAAAAAAAPVEAAVPAADAAAPVADAAAPAPAEAAAPAPAEAAPAAPTA